MHDIEDVLGDPDDPSIFNGRITSEAFRNYRDKRGLVLADYFKSCIRGKLKVGTEIWKCVSNRLAPTGWITPWWCLIKQLDKDLERCMSVPCSLSDYARSRLAVSPQFSATMEVLLKARLRLEAYAFYGPAKGVSMFWEIDEIGNAIPIPRGKVNFIGGETQLCIPELKAEYLQIFAWENAAEQPFGWRQIRRPQSGLPSFSVIPGGRR